MGVFKDRGKRTNTESTESVENRRKSEEIMICTYVFIINVSSCSYFQSSTFVDEV